MKHFSFFIAFFLLLCSCNTFKRPDLYVVTSSDNDLITILQKQKSFRVVLLNDASDVEKKVPENGSLLILSNHYPEERVELTGDFYNNLASKQIRAY